MFHEAQLLTSFTQFAKHFKVEEQVQFLKKSKTGIAVGTPARLEALLDNGELLPLLQPAKSRIC